MASKKTAKNFEQEGVDDLVMLPKVTEDQIIENIKKRYMVDLIYCNIGPVLVSINPFKRIPIFEQQHVQMYQGKFRHELPPHIFALAEETYRAMKNEGENQCVIISGESGAGKTEASKLIMNYVAAVSGAGQGVEYVKSVILDSNPLLEAFGNAKTLRNNNSSRFGKYFEIKFDARGDPCGGTITNYLLEKSRVTFQNQGERNFHVFYQVLAGASEDEAQRFQLYELQHFTYVNQSGCSTVDGMDDVHEYHDMKKAMATMAFTAQEQSDCIQMAAAILHIGNLAFVEDGKGSAQFYDPNALEIASQMLQVDSFALSSAILFRVINTGGPGGRSSTYNVPQNVEQANSAKDALSKVIYSRMFDFIVQKVNVALQKTKAPHKAHIGILDIFGFEIFKSNGFEQFCINFVNEKLQQFFIELTLKAEQDEYVKEGIKWEPIKYFNNQIVCDLIEGKAPPGIFLVLDDICATAHATSAGIDTKFLGKLSGAHPSHLHLRCTDSAFTVKHYAGEVRYDVDGFCEKNKDTLFNDIIETMQCSTNNFVVALFPDDTKQLQKKRPTSAGFKIKTSAGQLMTALSQCTPHYIRCIKPNETKLPNDFDRERVAHQVKYLGLFENVRVRRAGFAYRAEFARFLGRYKKLSRKTWGLWGEWSGDPKEGCTTLVQDLQLEQKQWQLGKTKIFIRHPESLFFLEELLERRDYDCTVLIQRAWKVWQLKKKALEQRRKIADIMRGKKERQRDSPGRQFKGDYLYLNENAPLQEVVGRDETLVFAEQVTNLNRRAQPERRDLIVTDRNIYLTMRKKKDGKIAYESVRRTPLGNIAGVSLSSLADNYIVVNCPGEYDMCFECEHKTELIILLIDTLNNSTGRQITVNFSDNITWKIKTKDTRTCTFQKNESASKAQIKKQGKTIQINIASGLPKDTDTAPQLPARTTGGGGAGRGGAGAARGGASAGRGGAGVGRAAAASQPAAVATQSAAASSPASGAGRAGRGGPAASSGAGTTSAGAGAGAGRGAGGAGAAAAGAAGRGGNRMTQTPRGPPPKPAVPQAKALYEYQATTGEDISFNEGDILTIVQKDAGGWWEAELNGQRGWIPANYVQEL
eukprot:TRINITY_DN3_c0_g1_i1.p1 TRINITY_DN3_c0_g1~~TRINITY_DN3_c0_g1_i1.p1  ORF type:complete len:1096 (-),score=666.41 TRINITY_DN3_c0_g1_i1:101-3388(-)